MTAEFRLLGDVEALAADGVEILRQPGGYLIAVDECQIDLHRVSEIAAANPCGG